MDEENEDGLWGGYDYNSPNVASAPAACGLEILAECEYSSGSYEFDTRIVWRHLETGKLYTARDSGCSCPTPFEDYRSLSDLEDFNYTTIRSEVLKESMDRYSALSASEARDFLNQIRGLR